jgi:acetyl-CoA acyltransferase
LSSGDHSPAYIVAALRTPVGKYGGVLRSARPDDLASLVLRAAVDRTGVSPERIDEVILGCANQAGEDNRNVARMAVLIAGFPYSIPAFTVNRLCGSSLEAVNSAARMIRTGDAECVIAGGVESMTRAPYAIPKNSTGQVLFGNLTAYDTALGWRFPNPRIAQRVPLESMGETAENLAERFEISREDQDTFALESHRRAVRAQDEGRFVEEIVPVDVIDRNGNATRISADEGPRRDTDLERLSSLKPVFRSDGTVTAGNSSGLNDGAAAVLVCSEGFARANSLSPIAEIISSGVAGVDPRFMGIGPVPATEKALRRAKLPLDKIGLIELNEAFAAQSLAVMREAGFEHSIINVNGGAIALGHPLGASGARILTTLVHEMKRTQTQYGLATMCIGVGQGISTIIKLT